MSAVYQKEHIAFESLWTTTFYQQNEVAKLTWLA